MQNTNSAGIQKGKKWPQSQNNKGIFCIKPGLIYDYLLRKSAHDIIYYSRSYNSCCYNSFLTNWKDKHLSELGLKFSPLGCISKDVSEGLGSSVVLSTVDTIYDILQNTKRQRSIPVFRWQYVLNVLNIS